MAEMMWTGRFYKELDSKVNAFNSSISFDGRMYRHDIMGSIAHAKMLGECGIISREDSEALVAELEKVFEEIENGTLQLDKNAEDIHMFIESVLTKRLGEVGKRLHTARSRNDQVALDIRLYLRDETWEIEELLEKMIGVLCDIAEKHTHTVIPGYTHMQRAQPITFGHHLMAYAQMFLRDRERIRDARCRMDECPLGCGALAGTTYPIDRDRTAELLRFSRAAVNSLDGVSDRDFCIELANAISIIMMHLSRFSEEIILWCSWEFKFIELDDAYATGSSIMPQKKNPDIAELVRGKCARVIGDNMTLLTMMKGLPLAYNKDMQ
ncbi:MAG TPA: argininosuccinate lyase, partial [Ruminococcaceae bacterium]|nr:argininosuccinate lyase [Oscillospiraceae bacterium]